jgi:ubiquitin carboxyl-terminal hydrolase L3
MSPDERSSLVENSEHLENAYAKIAIQGISRQPDHAEDEVDYHYICLVRSDVNGHLYELDGDRKGPIDRGVLRREDDLRGEAALAVVKEYFEDNPGDISYSLLALVVKQDGI